MTETQITADDVLAVHNDLVRYFADAEDPIEPPGVRDMNLLESACARPFTSLGDVEKYPSVEKKAGALLHSLIMNHAFYNGNKRTALVSMVAYLGRNDRIVSQNVSDDDVFDFVTSIAANDFPAKGHSLRVDKVVERISEWIRRRTTKAFTAISVMPTTEFLAKVNLAGGSYKDSENGWTVRGPNNKAITISAATRRLDGNVVRTYLRSLGLSASKGGFYPSEFVEGVNPEQEFIRRFRDALIRLAHA